MDRPTFAETLRQAVIGVCRDLAKQKPAESHYAFALIGGQENYLGYAVATEEGLSRVAAHYDARGYRYQGWE